MTAEPQAFTPEWAAKVYGPNSRMVQAYAPPAPPKQVIIRETVLVPGQEGPPGRDGRDGTKGAKGDAAPIPPKPAKVVKTLLKEIASNSEPFTVGMIVEELDARGRVTKRVLNRLLKEGGSIIGVNEEELDPRLCDDSRPIAKAEITVLGLEGVGPIKRTTTWDKSGKVIGFVDELYFKVWEDTGSPGWSEKEEL